MRTTITIARRELVAYFNSPVAYALMGLFLAVNAYLFFMMYGNNFFLQNTASMRTFFGTLPWVMLFYIPLISMRLWAEEKKLGTDEMLLTYPVTDTQAILGKYFGSLAFVGISLVATLPFYFIVHHFGTVPPDPGPIIGGYLAAFFLGASYLAIGATASALTENQVIAALLAMVSIFILMMLNFAPLPAVAFLSPLWHFESVGRGVLDTRTLVYFGSLIVWFLTLNTWFINRRSWG